MNQNLETWIAAQRTKILEGDDQVMFDEVAKCLLAGCYRAAYILGWVMIAESLKRKIYQLNSLGDKNAKNAVEEIEKLEKDSKPVDSIIREKVATCGIADPSEVSKLEFLWKQRCVFAHPYQKSPDEEEVKHLIDQAIKVALGKELLFTKVYLEELASSISNTAHFLPNDRGVVETFAKKTIARTGENLIQGFFKKLMWELDGALKVDIRKWEVAKLRWFIGVILEETVISYEDAGWRFESSAKNHPFESIAGFVNKNSWPKLPSRIKGMLMAYYQNETDANKLFLIREIYKQLVEASVLESGDLHVHCTKLEEMPFIQAIGYYGNTELQFQRIIREIDSGNFERQNVVMDFVITDKGQAILQSSSIESQIDFGKEIRFEAIRGNWKYKGMYPSILSGNYGFSDYVRLGIALLLFESTTNSPIRDEKMLLEFIKSVNPLSPSAQKIAYQRIELSFSAKPADALDLECFDKDDFFEKIENLTADFEWSQGHKELFDGLVSKVVEHFTGSTAQKTSDKVNIQAPPPPPKRVPSPPPSPTHTATVPEIPSDQKSHSSKGGDDDEL